INALASSLDFALAIDKDKDERGEPYVGMEALKRTRDAGGPIAATSNCKISHPNCETRTAQQTAAGHPWPRG
ncbi:MAG: hypothetical protein ACKVZJ_10130, partial [Phycisphaerales bacterium]